jgi:hypothetical protein
MPANMVDRKKLVTLFFVKSLRTAFYLRNWQTLYLLW